MAASSSEIGPPAPVPQPPLLGAGVGSGAGCGFTDGSACVVADAVSDLAESPPGPLADTW
jgi:hypothetical protein